MSERFYVYAADVYCEECGKALRNQLTAPDNVRDEHSYDSKGPYDTKDERSDTPEHCGNHANCLDPLILNGERYGKFLGTPLTLAGEAYVKQQHRESPSPITEMWMRHYDLQ